eukprot:TRINITY_DN3845_c0_g1_i4.p2 TRINITY_DN3845_c0_g1~~TRINITY_DN3845_c0_g1_i4.p2  ORF type:complete len:108 (+),score=8.04 TRINITY_DN3845_c0_g1_i4:38-361(+)
MNEIFQQRSKLSLPFNPYDPPRVLHVFIQHIKHNNPIVMQVLSFCQIPVSGRLFNNRNTVTNRRLRSKIFAAEVQVQKSEESENVARFDFKEYMVKCAVLVACIMKV